MNKPWFSAIYNIKIENPCFFLKEMGIFYKEIGKSISYIFYIYKIQYIKRKDIKTQYPYRNVSYLYCDKAKKALIL